MILLTQAEVDLLERLFTAGAEPLSAAEIQSPFAGLYHRITVHQDSIRNAIDQSMRQGRMPGVRQ
jgi:hypothetical protein